MATKDPRKAHVIRYYRKNDDGTKDTTFWIDILRLDKFKMQQRPTYQIVNNVTDKWEDGPDDTPNLDRKMDKLKIKNPNDATNIIEIDILRQLKVTNNQTGQATIVSYANGDDNLKRKSVVKRVQHRELDETQVDVTKPMPWDDYLKALDTTGEPDSTNYLDVEVPKDFWMNDDDLSGPGPKFYVTVQNRLVSDDLLKLMIDVPPSSGDDDAT